MTPVLAELWEEKKGKKRKIFGSAGQGRWQGIHSDRVGEVLCKEPGQLQVFDVSSLLSHFFWLDREPKWSLPSLSSMSMLFLEILSCHSPGYAFNTQNLWVEETPISKRWLWQDELLHHLIHL